MASQRALLVVYLVSLVYVRSAKCLGKEEAVSGRVGRGGGTPQSAQDPKASLYSWWPGVNSVPNPTTSELNLGKIIFYLINYLRKKNERKETASLSADSLFNQLHKKCTEKNKNHIVQIYVTSTPKEIIKQWGDIEQRCTITFSVMKWNWWKRLR